MVLSTPTADRPPPGDSIRDPATNGQPSPEAFACTVARCPVYRDDATLLQNAEDGPGLLGDRLPAPAANAFGTTGIDLGSSRYLGKGMSLSYYAVSKGTNLICMIPVGPDGAGKSMGCGQIKGFGNYGLRTGNPPDHEEAWLIVPNSGQVALGKDPFGGWVVEADSFLVKETSAP
ncbi:hypothetical protein [Sinomonas susongensis]|uniref:hypothetical protein n=1 Tax=Sinomonas susongensis TaxID=1324851 RepID=UPI001BB19FFE|nr:hypothetical protein [Sinomonas susongensis]